MKRTQLQLDERTHAALKRRAFESGCSMSELARRLLGEALGTRERSETVSLANFSFVGAGASEQAEEAPVSERHDEALAAPE